jgi:hypothetical protein
MKYLIHDFMKTSRRDQNSARRDDPRSGRRDSDAKTIPWGEARRSAAECAMHSPVESSRGEKRGFCGVKPRDSGLSRGEKRILLLVRLNYLPTSLRA